MIDIVPERKVMSTAVAPRAQSCHHKIQLFRITKRLYLVAPILRTLTNLATTYFPFRHYHHV